MNLGSPIALLLAGTTVVAAVLVVRGLRRIIRHGEWDRGATLGLVLAALMSSAIGTLVTFSDGWITTVDPFYNVVYSFPAWAQLAQRGFIVMLLGMSFLIFVAGIYRPGTRINIPAALFVLVAMTSAISALVRGDNPLRPYYLVPIAVLIAMTMAPRGIGVTVGVATSAVVVAVGSGLAAFLRSDFSLIACGTGKCGFGGSNLRGVFDNENALALYLALSMPFVYLAFGRRSGLVLSAYFALLVLMTGSRTGLAAAGITVVMLAVTQPDLRRWTYHRVRAWLLFGVVGVTLAIGLVLPYLVNDPEKFTSRGHLWLLARAQLSDPLSTLIGRGTFGWQHVREAGLIDFSAVYSVHNQWLDVTYKAGIVGLALTLTALVAHVVLAGRRYALVAGAVLVPVVVLGITERPWGIDYADWLIWALPAVLLCYPHVPRAAVADVDPAAAASEPAGGSGSGRLPGPDQPDDAVTDLSENNVLETQGRT